MGVGAEISPAPYFFEEKKFTIKAMTTMRRTLLP